MPEDERSGRTAAHRHRRRPRRPDAEPIQAAIGRKYRRWMPVVRVGYAIRNVVTRTRPGPEAAIVVAARRLRGHATPGRAAHRPRLTE